MSKEEVKSVRHIWAANVKAPIDRDIEMMKITQERNLSRINKIVHRLEKKGKGI
jgi:hypothetical protein